MEPLITRGVAGRVRKPPVKAGSSLHSECQPPHTTVSVQLNRLPAEHGSNLVGHSNYTIVRSKGEPKIFCAAGIGPLQETCRRGHC